MDWKEMICKICYDGETCKHRGKRNCIQLDEIESMLSKAEEEKKELIEVLSEIKAELARYGFKKTCKAIDQLLQKYSDKKEDDK